jgi:hypothetical protein
VHRSKSIISYDFAGEMQCQTGTLLEVEQEAIFNKKHF